MHPNLIPILQLAIEKPAVFSIVCATRKHHMKSRHEPIFVERTQL